MVSVSIAWPSCMKNITDPVKVNAINKITAIWLTSWRKNKDRTSMAYPPQTCSLCPGWFL